MVIALLALLLGAIAPEPDARPIQILLWPEPAAGTYSVKFWHDPVPLIDSAHVSFTLVSYDKARTYSVPYVVNGTEPSYRGVSKTNVDGVELHVKILLPPLPADMYTLSVRSTDAPNATGLTSLDLYIPDRSAKRLADLGSHYSDVTVWPYGSLSLRCEAVPFTVGGSTVQNIFASATGQLRVNRIERVRGRSVMMNDFSSNAGLRYQAIDPLVLHIAAPSSLAGMGLGWSTTGGPSIRAGGPRPEPAIIAAIQEHCTEFVAYAGDAWDLKRLVSLRPPDIDAATHPDVIGLTHEQVAFRFGFPYVYRSRDEMLKMPEWFYERAAPFSATVTFEGDRVVRYAPPGRLP
jgi:hypothetical protein